MKKSADWLIALGVIVCSAVLLAALAFALTGNPFDNPTRTLRVRLPDVTGVQKSSLVKFGGAPAGTIRRVRILTSEERLESSDPEAAVELILAIQDTVPSFTEGTSASVSADTLLADKFILLSAGPADARKLTDGELIPGIPPTTIDEMVRTLDRTLRMVDGLVNQSGDEAPGIFDSVESLLDEAKATLARVDGLIVQADGTLSSADQLMVQAEGSLTGADELIDDADALVESADDLVNGDNQSLKTLIADLSATAEQLEGLSARAEKLIDDNADNLDATFRDARVAVQNLKVTATYAKALALALTKRPQQLLWGPGRSPIEVPTEGQILRSKEVIPLD
ncbi:MAG: MlaD family protein [Chthoniobacterales bacterium]